MDEFLGMTRVTEESHDKLKTKYWCQIHKGALHNFYFSHKMSIMIIPYTILVIKSKGKRIIGRPRCRI
jgi:hypothetical protein